MQLQYGYRHILKIALPLSFSLLIPQISFFANTAFLGRVGNEELVVNGLSSIFYLLFIWMGMGLSNGILVVMSRRQGQGDVVGFAQTFANGILLTILVSVILFAFAFFFAPVILHATLSNPVIKAQTAEFLHIRLWGLFFLMPAQLINVFFIAINKSKLIIWGALVSNLVIIFLDYGLIFGNFGLPQFGLMGAAYASLFGELALLLTAASVFFIKKLNLLYRIKENLLFSKNLCVKLLKVSSPLLAQYVFSIGGWQVFFVYVEHLGVNEVAVSHILRSLLGIVSIVTWALASTCNTIVSNVIGQGKESEVGTVIKRIISLSFGYTLTVVVLILLIPREFMSLYTDNVELIDLSVKSIYMLCGGVLFMSLSTILFNAVVGTGNTLVNLLIEASCVILYIIYVLIVAGYLKLPLHWAWASEIVYWFTLLVFSAMYLFSGRWKGKKI